MKTILFLLCVAVTISAQAQVEVDFGVKTGVNFSHQNIANSGLAFLPKNRTSFNGGVYFHAKKGRFGILSEVAYSMQGGNYNYPDRIIAARIPDRCALRCGDAQYQQQQYGQYCGHERCAAGLCIL